MSFKAGRLGRSGTWEGKIKRLRWGLMQQFRAGNLNKKTEK
jgi:hypothetical protein